MAANRWVLLAAVPLFLVLAGVVYLTMAFARDERDHQDWVLHTYQVMDALRAVMGDADDAETGQRGYLLTHETSFLAPYREAQARMGRDLARFAALTRDNPDQQRRAIQLRSLLRERLQILDAVIDRNAMPQPIARPLLDVLAEGKQAMDTLRIVVAAGLDEETRLLDERVAARRAVERAEIAAAVLAVLLALAVLLSAAILLVRNNARLAVSEALRARQARILQATLDNIRDGILVFDETDRVAAFNNVFFRLMDFPERLAAIGAALDTFRQIDDAQQRRFFLEVPITGAGESRIEHFTRADRELEIYRAAVPGAGFLVAAADVTARARAEIVMRQAQKMEAVGHLTGGVAHDFNNLLQIIGANLDLAVAEARGNPKTAERLQNAIAAVERGSRLTAQLLAFARRQALEPRSTDLGRLIGGMTDLMRRTLGERVEIEAAVAGGLWNTLVDPAQVENAILNLAINARDAMPDGGKLTIEVSNAFLDDSYAAQHSEVTVGQYVMLAISDTGTGMAPDIMARVFDPFFTTKPEGKGTGLGLSQVYGFVKQSGGHVKVYSEVGQGTTVKIYLPRTKKPQEGLEPVAAHGAAGGSETILVVEDDAGVRAAVVDILTELGYAVLKAESAEQALAVIASGVRIDLLFTDVVMPGQISTRELARRAQELQPHIKVLFTSGYTQNAIVHNGRLDDDAVLLSKPYRKDDLARKLRSMLDGKPAPEPGAAPRASARGKVLVVEDEPLIRMTTVDMLQEIGCESAEAADASEALAILKGDSAVAILLTDLGLPDMNGAQLAEAALRLRPDLKVIVASGYSTETSRSLPAGTVSLTKPFDLGGLKRALESV